jgi:hypothetical protein
VRIHGHPEKRFPNPLSIDFRGIDAVPILAENRLAMICGWLTESCEKDHYGTCLGAIGLT